MYCKCPGRGAHRARKRVVAPTREGLRRQCGARYVDPYVLLSLMWLM